MERTRDIMTDNVRVIHPEATLLEAAQLMRNLDTGAVPVCDGTKLKGMVTDRDIVVRALSEGKDPRSTKVSDVMTAPVVYCYDDQQVQEAINLMESKQIRRLPVLNRDKKLVGIVSLGDVAVKGHNDILLAEAITRVSEPFPVDIAE